MPELYLLLFGSFTLALCGGFLLGRLYRDYETEKKYGLRK